MTEQELKEKIARQIWMDDSGSDTGWPTSPKIRKEGVCWRIADQILALIKEAGYVKLADNQDLPSNLFIKFKANSKLTMVAQKELGDTAIMAYKQSQQDMLQAGWKKVKLEGTK